MNGRLSSSLMSLKRMVWLRLTYSALRPVSGCVRATGCSASYWSALSVSWTFMPPIFLCIALRPPPCFSPALLTPTSPSTSRRMPSESAS
jgi:hypothetical protein